MAKREAKDQLTKEYIEKNKEETNNRLVVNEEADEEIHQRKRSRVFSGAAHSPEHKKEEASKFGLLPTENIEKKISEEKKNNEATSNGKSGATEKPSIFSMRFFGTSSFNKSIYPQATKQAQDPKIVSSFLSSGVNLQKKSEIEENKDKDKNKSDAKDDDKDDEEEEDDEESGKPNLLLPDFAENEEENNVPTISEKTLEPSPYEKLVSVNLFCISCR
jgi:hypothetical protein